MDRTELLQRIRAVPLFQELSDEEVEHILAAAKQVEFPAGRTIAQQGQIGVGFHLILEGEAEVIVGDQRRSNLGPGDYFGEISLLDEGPRSATVRTTKPTKTLSLASWDFMPLLDRYPSMTRKLLVGLCRRIRAIESVTGTGERH
jgi:CRP/FNR family cyclic AMP-dependent transcriptional regulator